MKYLFVPAFAEPLIQPRTYSEIDRRDTVFPNRNIEANNNWGHIYKELAARLVLFEFKNYDREVISKDETNQTRNYLTKPMGKLAIICCKYAPNDAAHIKRKRSTANRAGYSFVTTEQLIEMLFIKERGEDTFDLIMDMIERFYLQHE